MWGAQDTSHLEPGMFLFHILFFTLLNIHCVRHILLIDFMFCHHTTTLSPIVDNGRARDASDASRALVSFLTFFEGFTNVIFTYRLCIPSHNHISTQ